MDAGQRDRRAPAVRNIQAAAAVSVSTVGFRMKGKGWRHGKLGCCRVTAGYLMLSCECSTGVFLP